MTYKRHSHCWDCECCGSIFDETLDVEVNGVTVGVFCDDGHFGDSRIVETEVEQRVVEALGETDAYRALLERRAEDGRVACEMLEKATTDVDRDAAYAWADERHEDFGQWLQSLGHEVVEEYTSSDDRPSYEDNGDGYGEPPDDVEEGAECVEVN